MTARQPTDWKSPEMRKRIAARYASERRFRAIGLIAIVMSAGFLAYLLISMMHAGLGGFSRTEVTVQIDFPKAPIVLDPASVRGPKRGSATPPAAAASPRKPMAKLNVHATWALVQP